MRVTLFVAAMQPSIMLAKTRSASMTQLQILKTVKKRESMHEHRMQIAVQILPCSVLPSPTRAVMKKPQNEPHFTKSFFCAPHLDAYVRVHQHLGPQYHNAMARCSRTLFEKRTACRQRLPRSVRIQDRQESNANNINNSGSAKQC